MGLRRVEFRAERRHLGLGLVLAGHELLDQHAVLHDARAELCDLGLVGIDSGGRWGGGNTDVVIVATATMAGRATSAATAVPRVRLVRL